MTGARTRLERAGRAGAVVGARTDSARRRTASPTTHSSRSRSGPRASSDDSSSSSRAARRAPRTPRAPPSSSQVAQPVRGRIARAAHARAARRIAAGQPSSAHVATLRAGAATTARCRRRGRQVASGQIVPRRRAALHVTNAGAARAMLSPPRKQRVAQSRTEQSTATRARITMETEPDSFLRLSSTESAARRSRRPRPTDAPPEARESFLARCSGLGLACVELATSSTHEECANRESTTWYPRLLLTSRQPPANVFFFFFPAPACPDRAHERRRHRARADCQDPESAWICCLDVCIVSSSSSSSTTASRPAARGDKLSLMHGSTLWFPVPRMMAGCAKSCGPRLMRITPPTTTSPPSADSRSTMSTPSAERADGSPLQRYCTTRSFM